MNRSRDVRLILLSLVVLGLTSAPALAQFYPGFSPMNGQPYGQFGTMPYSPQLPAAPYSIQPGNMTYPMQADFNPYAQQAGFDPFAQPGYSGLAYNPYMGFGLGRDIIFNRVNGSNAGANGNHRHQNQGMMMGGTPHLGGHGRHH